MRLVSDQARVDSHKFRTGQLPREDRAKITDTLNFLATVPLWIDDSGAHNCHRNGRQVPPHEARQGSVSRHH